MIVNPWIERPSVPEWTLAFVITVLLACFVIDGHWWALAIGLLEGNWLARQIGRSVMDLRLLRDLSHAAKLELWEFATRELS